MRGEGIMSLVYGAGAVKKPRKREIRLRRNESNAIHYRHSGRILPRGERISNGEDRETRPQV